MDLSAVLLCRALRVAHHSHRRGAARLLDPPALRRVRGAADARPAYGGGHALAAAGDATLCNSTSNRHPRSEVPAALLSSVVVVAGGCLHLVA